MKAIILAAGKATRLLPLTKETPQCLLEVNGKTILEMQIDILKKGGIRDVVVVTGYLSEKVEEFCNKKKIKTLFNPFYDVSGMALTLWVAKEELNDGFVFVYSDILFDSGIVDGILKNKGDICLAINKDGLREEAEKVIEKEGIINKVSKAKMEGENGEFIGIAKFSSKGAENVIAEIDAMAKGSLSISFIRVIDRIIADGNKVNAFDIGDSKFIDIDFPDDLKKAEGFFN